MKPSGTLALSLALSTILASTAAVAAPDHAAGGSGFLHVVGDANHFTGFLLAGAMGGFYVHLSGRWLLPCATMLPLAVLASHAHAPVTTGDGLLFASGFLAAGLLLALAAARLALGLAEARAGRRGDRSTPIRPSNRESR